MTYLLHLADTFLCCFVFMTLKVCYWRGIWDLYGVYVFPDNSPLNHWTKFAIGSCCIVGYLTLPVFHDYLGTCSRLVRVTATRLLMFIYALANMANWRALWCLTDYYMGFDLTSNLITFLICLFSLLVLRAFTTTIFAPMTVAIDTRKDVLLPNTRFHTQPSLSIKYVADCLFTHFILTTLAIISWRSAWNVVGSFWYPEDSLFSDITSLALGLCGCLILNGLEQVFITLSVGLQKINWYLRLCYEGAVCFLGFSVLVFAWRGYWNLNAAYLIADPLVGGWVNFAVGTIGLMAFQVFSYVGCCGCAIDCAEAPEMGVFHTSYLRLYSQRKITKEIVKEFQSGDHTMTLLTTETEKETKVSVTAEKITSAATPVDVDSKIKENLLTA